MATPIVRIGSRVAADLLGFRSTNPVFRLLQEGRLTDLRPRTSSESDGEARKRHMPLFDAEQVKAVAAELEREREEARQRKAEQEAQALPLRQLSCDEVHSADHLKALMARLVSDQGIPLSDISVVYTRRSNGFGGMLDSWLVFFMVDVK